MDDYQVSSMNIIGVSNGMRDEGLLESVTAAVGQEARDALADPRSKKWYPSRVALDIMGTIVRIASRKKLTDVYYRMTRDSFGPVMGPLIKVALAIGGSTPAALLSKLGTLLKVSAQGVTATWAPVGKDGGTVTLDYVSDMTPLLVEYSWRGILRYGENVLSRSIGTPTFEVVSPRQFKFHFDWA